MQFRLRPFFSRFAYLALMLFLSIALIPTALAKSSLSPIADFMKEMYGKGNYSCNITDTRATCTSNVAKDLDSVRLDNLSLYASMSGKRATFSVVGMFSPKGRGNTAEDKAVRAMLPRKVECTFDVNLNASILNQDFFCKANHDPYDVKIKFYVDLKHKGFVGASGIKQAMSSIDANADQEKLLKELFIKIKAIEVEIDSTQPKLSEAIYDAVSAYEPNITKSEYEGSVAIFASMVPIFLASADKLSSETKESVSKIGLNLSEIALAKKKYISVILKNKLNNFMRVEEFIDLEQDDLLFLLNQSEITVKSK